MKKDVLGPASTMFNVKIQAANLQFWLSENSL